MPDPQSSENSSALTGAPVQPTPAGMRTLALTPGIALCLSGGGYRAMLFHVGSLWRLNELGLLSRLDRISSVSGGSITAGVLGLHWAELDFNEKGVSRNFTATVVTAVRRLAAETLDIRSVLTGLLTPGSVAERVAAHYDKFLFAGQTLQHLPDHPRFVINATNVQSGALWRFAKSYMRDYRVGEIRQPQVRLAVAVAASSAFPPFLSPLELKFKEEEYTPHSGLDLQHSTFTTQVFLTDGGVYDNLGLETAWKRYTTILVSDAGGQLAPQAEPDEDWPRHAYRVLNLIDDQVRNLRKRQVIASYQRGERAGAYWGIRTNIADYGLATALPCPPERTLALAEMPTRLKALELAQQERLINWGYAVCDAALRKHFASTLPEPNGFPYPAVAV